jgi:hypothetical protein
MPKKNNNILIVAVAVLVVLGLVWLFWYFSPKQRHTWYETYKLSDKEPYGEWVIGELLKSYHPGHEFRVSESEPVHEMIAPARLKGPSSYVLIGEALFLDSADVQTMLDFVSRGNDVFISSMELPHDLTVNLPDFQCYWRGYHFDDDTCAKMNFYHPGLKEHDPYGFTFHVQDEAVDYRWAYIDPDNLCGYNNTFTRLGYFSTRSDSEHINFVKVPHGAGNFYFHTDPLAFTNYFLVNRVPLDYASKVLSHLRPGDIYWDEYSKIPHSKNNSDPNNGDNDPGGRTESPLQFLLQQKSMRWAWFTLLFGVVFTFLIFRTKRRQRVIPLLEPNTNTSLEFVQTIGRLYFLQNNHRGLCKQMMRYFLAFIRNRYYLPTARVNDDLVIRIAQRSKVNAGVIREIFSQYDLLDKTAAEITDRELIAFHQSLEYFYKNCK